VRVRLTYAARSGEQSERVVEPYRLVATGRRWYLLAWDTDRADWRTFRLDRMRDVTPTTLRFRPREHPHPAAYVQRSVTSNPYRYHAVVRVFADPESVRDRVSPGSAVVEPETDTTCILRAGADSADALAAHLALIGPDLQVLQPPELREAAIRLGHRLVLAGRGDDS
jgi:predicted DNA-binding transcriptional regulator YafY